MTPLTNKEMRDLDAWIALHITKWKPTGESPVSSAMGNGLPHYSLMMGAAWLVVEKMMKDYEICIEADNHTDGAFTAQFYNYRTKETTFSIAHTGPLAICLAARKAFNKEKNNA